MKLIWRLILAFVNMNYLEKKKRKNLTSLFVFYYYILFSQDDIYQNKTNLQLTSKIKCSSIIDYIECINNNA